MPNESGFYAKLRAHEDRHVTQYATWGGLSDQMWSAQTYYTAIVGLTAASQYQLETQMANVIGQMKDEDDERPMTEFWLACERDAYGISNPMAPRYFYNRYM